MYPTTLAALGVKIEDNKLGLGVNLFSNEKTLIEKYNFNDVNNEFYKKSVFYNSNILYKISSSDNQNNNLFSNCSTIKLNDCEKKLKEVNNLPDITFFIFTLSYGRILLFISSSIFVLDILSFPWSSTLKLIIGCSPVAIYNLITFSSS